MSSNTAVLFLAQRLEEARNRYGIPPKEWRRRAVRLFGSDTANLLVGTIKSEKPAKPEHARSKVAV